MKIDKLDVEVPTWNPKSTVKPGIKITTKTHYGCQITYRLGQMLR